MEGEDITSLHILMGHLSLPRRETTVTTPIYSFGEHAALLYAFAGGAFWKVAPYITDQSTCPKERTTLITTNLFDARLEFGDGRGDEFQLVFTQLAQRMDLLDTVRLSRRLTRVSDVRTCVRKKLTPISTFAEK
jgi:hypothetical protein